MDNEQLEPTIFNFNIKLEGRLANCSLRQNTWEGERQYKVYMNIANSVEEFPMIFDKLRNSYFFGPEAPMPLRMIEGNLSDIICDRSGTC